MIMSAGHPIYNTLTDVTIGRRTACRFVALVKVHDGGRRPGIEHQPQHIRPRMVTDRVGRSLGIGDHR